MGTAIAIKERPILFSGEMVRAILEGRKTQTRRILKPQIWNEAENTPGGCGYAWHPKGKTASSFAWKTTEQALADYLAARYCPYGKPGDRLWVREAWGSADKFYQCHENDVPSVVAYRADRSAIQYDAKSPRQIPDWDIAQWNWDKVKWKPSIHMPRWVSRITLEITSIRVERLQDITQAGCMAEGCPETYWNELATSGERDPFLWFTERWDAINGKKAPWESNPWVWVITFKRMESKI